MKISFDINKKSVIVFMGVVVGTALLDVVIFKDAFNISFSKFNLVLRFILRNVVEIGLMSIGGGVGYVLAKVNKDNQLIIKIKIPAHHLADFFNS